MNIPFSKSRDSERLQAGRPGFDTEQGLNFSLLHNVQTGTGAHPASYRMGTAGCFPAGKAAGM
jgi:hypothetical protein